MYIINIEKNHRFDLMGKLKIIVIIIIINKFGKQILLLLKKKHKLDLKGLNTIRT